MTDVHKGVPPPFSVPLSPIQDLVVGGVLIQNRWPKKRKDVDKGIVVEYMNMFTAGWATTASRP